MRKLLIVLLALPALSFAESLDMSTLACKDLNLTSATTLQEVQDNCLLKKQKKSNGLFEVKFINDATSDTVVCHFASNKPEALLNSCKG